MSGFLNTSPKLVSSSSLSSEVSSISSAEDLIGTVFSETSGGISSWETRWIIPEDSPKYSFRIRYNGSHKRFRVRPLTSVSRRYDIFHGSQKVPSPYLHQVGMNQKRIR